MWQWEDVFWILISRYLIGTLPSSKPIAIVHTGDNTKGWMHFWLPRLEKIFETILLEHLSKRSRESPCLFCDSNLCDSFFRWLKHFSFPFLFTGSRFYYSSSRHLLIRASLLWWFSFDRPPRPTKTTTTPTLHAIAKPLHTIILLVSCRWLFRLDCFGLIVSDISCPDPTIILLVSLGDAFEHWRFNSRNDWHLQMEYIECMELRDSVGQVRLHCCPPLFCHISS
jgi:hypothetical protein